jgi:hypothetical protein
VDEERGSYSYKYISDMGDGRGGHHVQKDQKLLTPEVVFASLRLKWV